MAFDPDTYFEEVLAYAEPGGSDPIGGPIAAWRQRWHLRWLDCGDDVIGRLAREQGFVLTTAQAKSLGVTANDIRRSLRRGTLCAPARGVLSPIVTSRDGPAGNRRNAALEAAAAVLLRPRHVISGRSAAVMHGVPTFRVPDSPQLTARERRTTGDRSSTHVFSARLAEPDIAGWYGATTATLARTLVDLGRHDRRDALIATDAALHEQVVTRAELDAALAQALGWPYSKRAREILALADGRAESPLESLVRLALHDDGFPPPELQFVIGPYRVDFYWPTYGFVLEADGRLKYDSRTRKYDDQNWRDKRREIALRRLGVRAVERVVWDDVLTTASWRRASGYLRTQLLASPPV